MTHREADLERHLRRLVQRDLDGLLVKIAPTRRGVPDRLVILPGGRVQLVELKTERGRLSPIQAAWHEMARQRGVNVHVLHGREEIDQWVAGNKSANSARKGII